MLEAQELKKHLVDLRFDVAIQKLEQLGWEKTLVRIFATDGEYYEQVKNSVSNRINLIVQDHKVVDLYFG